jgi:hypothetical protein
MKLVFASIFAAVASALPYNPDSRPSNPKIVEPASWIEEIEANIGQDCAVNPYILNLLIGKLPATQTAVQRKTVWSSLRKCKDNEAVKHIFTIDYLMKNKANLYNDLLEVGDGKSTFDHNNDGTKDYVKDFLQLDTTGKKTFKQNLQDWSKSKVAVSMMKWKYYNDFFNGAPLQKFQFWTRKANDLKTHKADAEKKYTNKLEQIREYKPFLKPFMRKEIAPAAPVAPIVPIAPIIPAEPMPVAVSQEEQAEQKQYLPVKITQ